MTLGNHEELDNLFKRKRDTEPSEGVSNLSAEHALESLADLYAAFSGSSILSAGAKPHAAWPEQEVAEPAVEEEEPGQEIEPEAPLKENVLEYEEQDVMDDPVRMYLREIGNVSLLNANEEKVLASKMEQDRHIKKIKNAWLARYLSLIHI